MTDNLKFRYLNLENRWPDFQLASLEIQADGALTLARVPALANGGAFEMGEVDARQIPAGVAADREGNLYISDPLGGRLFKYDACTGAIAPIRCLDAMLDDQTFLNAPRGLLVADEENTLFVVDSGNHRIVLLDLHTFQTRDVWGHSGTFANTRPSDDPGRLDTPWDLTRDKNCHLYVADYGNHRVQKFTRRGRVVPGFWQKIADQAVLQNPAYVAVGEINGEERLFVIDKRQQFTPPVIPLEIFPNTSTLLLGNLRGNAKEDAQEHDTVNCNDKRNSAGMHGEECETSADMAFVFDLDGALIKSWPVQTHDEDQEVDVAGIVVIAGAVYIGDNASLSVMKFDADGGFLGRAHGYEAPVAALNVDHKGNLLVHPGAGEKVVRLAPNAAFFRHGSFLAGPFRPESVPVTWHRIHLDPEIPREETDLQLFVYTSQYPTPPPFQPEEENPFSNAAWLALPRDVRDGMIPSNPNAQLNGATSPLPRVPAKYLWLGGDFKSDEIVSPMVRQIRLNYDQKTYLRHLPAVYADNANGRDFLERFLSLFESALSGVEEKIDGLPKFFDPQSISVDFLPWLAQWAALDLDEEWSERKKRAAIARAFQLHPIRGTAAGLREYVKLYADVDIHVDEPLLAAEWWCLPAKPAKASSADAQDSEREKSPEANWLICPPCANGQSDVGKKEKQRCPENEWRHANTAVLGVSTMLAPAHAQGAVVGSTATLDGSHLLEQEDFGAPLFEDLAYTFQVVVGRTALHCKAELDKIREVIDREKPAHTDYHLCVAEPLMRVGYQARVGVDTYVSGKIDKMVLGEHAQLGDETMLPDYGGVERTEGLLGRDSRLGGKVRVG